MLNFTTLHFSKFRNAKLQKKVDLCNTTKNNPSIDTRLRGVSNLLSTVTVEPLRPSDTSPKTGEEYLGQPSIVDYFVPSAHRTLEPSVPTRVN